jgi:hypothetical protein
MVFINSGEASSAQSSTMSLQQSSLETAIAAKKSLRALLAWLNVEIARRRAEEQSEEDTEEQSEHTEPDSTLATSATLEREVPALPARVCLADSEMPTYQAS